MRHRVSVKKLSKTPAHRKAMLRNMLLALYRHEKIKTTHAKSKVLQRLAERLITKAKQDTVHNRRIVAKWIQDKELLNKLFVEIAPKYAKRPGGYTRIVKIGPRNGDASEMVYISLVEEELSISKFSKKKTSTLKAVSPPKEKVSKNAKEIVEAEAVESTEDNASVVLNEESKVDASLDVGQEDSAKSVLFDEKNDE